MQTNPSLNGSVVGTTASIFRNEGITAFWKGAVPTAMGMAAENAMAFGVNEALKRAFPDDNQLHSTAEGGRPNMFKPFLMGMLTGCCSAIVLLPSEIVKAKTQVVVGSHSSDQIVKEMMKRGGLASFAVGLEGQLMVDGSYYALCFGSYVDFAYVLCNL